MRQHLLLLLKIGSDFIKLGLQTQMRGFCSLTVAQEVDDLRDHQFPLICVLLRSQHHVERERHVLVDLGKALNHEHVGVENPEEGFALVRQWQASQTREVYRVS